MKQIRFCLSIEILPNNFNIPFMKVVPNIKWVYCVSNSISSLNEFVLKILQLTPDQYKEYMRIRIDLLDRNISVINNITEGSESYNINCFYIEGIINRSLNYSIENFNESVWNWL